MYYRRKPIHIKGKRVIQTVRIMEPRGNGNYLPSFISILYSSSMKLKATLNQITLHFKLFLNTVTIL